MKTRSLLVLLSTVIAVATMAQAQSQQPKRLQIKPLEPRPQETKPGPKPVEHGPRTVSQPRARLDIASVRFAPVPSSAGSAVKLTVSVRNTGSAGAGPFAVAMKQGTSDVGLVSWRGLAVGETKALGIEVPIPERSGRTCYTLSLMQAGGGTAILGPDKRACGSVLDGRLARVKLTPARPIAGSRPAQPGGRVVSPRAERGGAAGTQYAVLSNALTVNESVGPVIVYKGLETLVRWNIAAVSPATGIYLAITPHSGSAGICGEGLPIPPDHPGWGHYAGYPNGSSALDLSAYDTKRTYYVYGCVWNADASPRYTGHKTNIVEIRYEAPSDLTVSDIGLQGNRVKFKVVNIGEGTKPASMPVFYGLTIEYLGRSESWGTGLTEATGEIAHSGGVVTTNSTLLPFPPLRVTVELSPLRADYPSGRIVESDTGNNSRTETWVELKPSGGSVNDADLFISEGKMYAGSGGEPGYAEIRIVNGGKKVAKDFFISVRTLLFYDELGLSAPLGGARVAKADVSLGPGEAKKVKIDFSLDEPYDDPSPSVIVSAFVDVYDTVPESNEINNWQVLDIVH